MTNTKFAKKENKMKIADALLLQQDLAHEITRLKAIGEQKSWTFMQRGSGEDVVPTFDIEGNHKRVMRLAQLKRKLSRAVSIANNTVELSSINDADYKDWL